MLHLYHSCWAFFRIPYWVLCLYFLDEERAGLKSSRALGNSVLVMGCLWREGAFSSLSFSLQAICSGKHIKLGNGKYSPQAVEQGDVN